MSTKMVSGGGRAYPFLPPFLVLVLPSPAITWECKETRRGREGGRKCEEGGEGEWWSRRRRRRRRRRVSSQGGSEGERQEGYVARGGF